MHSHEIEQILLDRQLPGLLPPEEGWVLPSYDGLSIANLPATIAALLGSDLPGALPPLPRELWADCPNLVLVELIEQFMRRTRRYELAAMRERSTVASSAGAKNEVHELLRVGKLAAACKRVRKSLMDGAQPVLAWLETRKASVDP